MKQKKGFSLTRYSKSMMSLPGPSWPGQDDLRMLISKKNQKIRFRNFNTYRAFVSKMSYRLLNQNCELVLKLLGFDIFQFFFCVYLINNLYFLNVIVSYDRTLQNLKRWNKKCFWMPRWSEFVTRLPGPPPPGSDDLKPVISQTIPKIQFENVNTYRAYVLKLLYRI